VTLVGYSDSNKDSGIVASRWAPVRGPAQAGRGRRGRGCEHRILPRPRRHGQPRRQHLVNGILGAPPDSVGGFLRLTEQGEVINQKYGVRFLAQRNLELVAGATLMHSLGRTTSLDADETAVLERIAALARRKFRGMVYDDPGFAPWFRQVTPSTSSSA
jgi:phosphoenolpyruvate carboxylase